MDRPLNGRKLELAVFGQSRIAHWEANHVRFQGEWGARSVEKGFLLEEYDDGHPMAWQRIIDPDAGVEADAAVTMKLWQQTRKHMAGFPGRTRMMDERQFLSFADYLKWKGRRNKGDLKSGMGTGLVVDLWNQWVEAQGERRLRPWLASRWESSIAT